MTWKKSGPGEYKFVVKKGTFRETWGVVCSKAEVMYRAEMLLSYGKFDEMYHSHLVYS